MGTSKRLFLVLLTLFFAANVLAVEKVDLKLKVEKGDKFHTTLAQDYKIDQVVNGMTMNIGQEIEMQIISEVLDINELGITDMKITYGDMKVSMQMPQGSFTYDTANPDPNQQLNPMLEPMKKMYTALKGVTLKAKINDCGKTLKFVGMDEMLDAMTEKLVDTDPSSGQAVKEMLKNFYNEDTINDMSNGMYGSYPDSPVAIGDVWDDITSFGSDQLPIDMDVTYMLKEIKDGFATINMTSKMDIGADDGKMIEMQGMEMNMIMSGVMNGFSKVDLDSGMPVENESGFTFSGSVKLAPSPQMPDGFTVPMSMKGMVKLKSEKIN